MDYRVLHPVDIPLGLHKNVFRIANLFAPEFELVVSDRVANDLAQISNLKLGPVSFEVLYEYPFVPGDLGCGFKTHDQQSDGSKASVDRPRSVRSRLLGLDHRGRYFGERF